MTRGFRPAVLFVTNETPSPLGGGSRVRDFNLLSRLSDRYIFTVLCFADDDDPAEVTKLQMFCERVVRVPRPRGPATAWGLRLRTALSIAHPIPLGVRQFTPRPIREVARFLCSEHNFDIVHVELTRMAHLLEKVEDSRLLTGMEVVSPKLEQRLHLARGPLTLISSHAELRKMRRYERHQFARADLCIMVSDKECTKVLALQPRARVAVVPNGVDVESFSRPARGATTSPARTVAFLGSMDYLPNTDAVLWFRRAIWPSIRGRDGEATWRIIGRNPPPEVRALASGDIAVTGWVDDVRPHLWSSSIMVVPLRSGSGTRLKILEAMAAGLPVVSTTIGAEGLEVVDGHNILIADSPEAFADAVVRLLKDPALTHQLSQNGRRLVEERYDWRMIAESLDAAYHKVLNGGHRT